MPPAKWIGWLAASLAATIPLYLIRFSLGPIQTTAWELLLYCAIGLALITQTLSLKVWQTDPLRWAWLLIAIGGLVSLLLSDNLRVGLGQWKALALDPLLLYWLLRSLVPQSLSVKGLMISSLIGAAALGISALGDLVRHVLTADNRAVGLFALDPGASPNYLALYLAPLVAFGVSSWLWVRERSAARWVIGGTTGLSLIGLVLSGSRGAGFAVIVSLTLTGLLAQRRTRRTQSPIMTAGLVTVLCLLGLLMIGQLRPDFRATDGGGRQTSSTNIRWLIWQTTVSDIIPTAPLVGLGWGDYQAVFGSLTAGQVNFPEFVTPMALHPHNFWLMSWVTLGIIGLLGWFLGIHKVVRRVLVTAHPLQPALLAAWITWLIQGLVDTTYYKNDLAALTIILMVAIVSLSPARVSTRDGGTPNTSSR